MNGKSMNIFLVSGWSTSGKDYLCNILVKQRKFLQFSFANKLKKHTAEKYGFPVELTRTQDGKKCTLSSITNKINSVTPDNSFTIRDLLILEGAKEREKNCNVWVNHVIEDITFMKRVLSKRGDIDMNVIISDWRFINEYCRLHDVFTNEFNIITVRVNRHFTSPVDDPSEHHLDSFDFDHNLYNLGDLNFDKDVNLLFDKLTTKLVV